MKYRKPMSNVFYGLPMNSEERESEAADVFMHYIKNLFDPEKEVNQREDWKFFSYLYSGMLGRRSKLRKGRVHLSYDESECDIESGAGALNAEMVSLSNRDLFMRYDPADAVVEELCLKTEIEPIHEIINKAQKIKTEYLRHILDCFLMPEKEGRTEHA
jgi:hypothetical protein